jgi:glycoside/pentoside/hexuronide:cation symporter, GPH family
MVALMFILPTVGGFGLGTLYLIPYSMIPDVVEMDELQTGERREGSFFSIFIFAEKVSTGICLAFSG